MSEEGAEPPDFEALFVEIMMDVAKSQLGRELTFAEETLARKLIRGEELKVSW